MTQFRSFEACVQAHARRRGAGGAERSHERSRQGAWHHRETRRAFNEKYGTNANKKNAFGKCVSAEGQGQGEGADAEDQQEATEFKNAAKECDDRARRHRRDAPAFTAKYGTNANKKNAFGKCVSQKAHDEETPPAS